MPSVKAEARLAVGNGEAAAPRDVISYMDGTRRKTRVMERRSLAAGETLAGPAILYDSTATVVVEPGWSVQHVATGDLVLTRVEEKRLASGARAS